MSDDTSDRQAVFSPLEIYSDVTALASFAAMPFVPEVVAPACLLVGTTALCGSLAEGLNRARRDAGAPEDFEPVTGIVEAAPAPQSRWRQMIRPSAATPSCRER